MKIKNFGRRRPIMASALAMLLSFGCMGADQNDPLGSLSLLGEEGLALAALLSNAIGTVDQDRDQIADNLERKLMRKFAPKYYLHHQETSFPSSVHWLLSNGGVQMKHNSDNLCKDNLVLDWGQATAANMGTRETRGKGGLFCRSTSTRYYSNRDYTENKRFYLRVAERMYPGNLASAKCYTRVDITPKSGAKYEIDYWFFYPYNPGVPATTLTGISVKGGNHQGDWEHVKVYVTADERVHSVDYASHGAPTNYKANDSRLTLIGGLRPKVYSARYSHASYPQARTYWRQTYLAVIHNDYTSGSGRVMDCASGSRLVNVGNAKHITPGNEWIKYRGAWGTKKSIWHPFADSGPTGPRMIGIDWNTQASISGRTSVIFPKGVNTPQTHGYTFNARLGNKLGSAHITGVSVTESTYASPSRSGNTINIRFRPRFNKPYATYRLKVTYSVPRAGGGGLRTTLTRYKSISVRYMGYQAPDCTGNPRGAGSRLIRPIENDCLY